MTPATRSVGANARAAELGVMFSQGAFGAVNRTWSQHAVRAPTPSGQAGVLAANACQRPQKPEHSNKNYSRPASARHSLCKSANNNSPRRHPQGHSHQRTSCCPHRRSRQHPCQSYLCHYPQASLGETTQRPLGTPSHPSFSKISCLTYPQR